MSNADTALAQRGPETTTLERLQASPLIDRIDAQTMLLLKSTVAQNASDAEVGMFLELAAHYDLDPFAKEVWCAKSRGRNGGEGRLLIMVGRDGLRKIAQRNGLHLDGDVVRERDKFTLCRTPDGNRTVSHSYGQEAKRGGIVGAWAECREGGPTGRPMGYFYAPLAEYLPPDVSSYSPWKKQVGVMILAAAERQAVRQATPLSGLLVEGENEVVEANALEGEAVEQAPIVEDPERAEKVEQILARAGELGHPGLADRAAAEMALRGQPDETVDDWIEGATAVLETVAAEQADEPEVEPADAEVVDGEQGDDERSSLPVD